MGLASVTARTAEELDRSLDEAEARPQATVIVVKVEESAPRGKPPLDCVFIKQRFMAAIGAPEGGTVGSARRGSP